MFASEQTIDALAHVAGMDPIAFRIQNIDASQTSGVARWIAVLNAVAQAANWKPAVSASKLENGNIVTGRGVAVGGFADSYPAIVANITVNKKTGVIKVDHLYAAQDASTTVNPASVENQMEGCIVQGVSRALMEEVRFTKVRQTSLDWITYPVIRFKQAPKLTAVVVQRLDQPSSGSGEPTTVAVPAAIANAFHDATGVRLYRMPMTPALVRGALGRHEETVTALRHAAGQVTGVHSRGSVHPVSRPRGRRQRDEPTAWQTRLQRVAAIELLRLRRQRRQRLR